VSELRQIGRNTGFLALARFADRLSGVVLGIYIARSLGVASLGVYSAATAYFALIAPAGELGFVNLLVREIARDRNRTNTYLVHAVGIASAASVAAMGIFVAVVTQLGFSHELTLALCTIALALLPGTLNSIQEAVFIAHQRVHFQTLVTAATSLANLGAGVLLITTGHGIVSLFVLFVVLEYVVTGVYFVLIGWRISPISLFWDTRFAKTFLRETRPFAGTSVVAALFARPEIIILSALSGAATVGYYSAAWKIAALWNDVTQVFMANVFPVLTRLHAEGDVRFDDLRRRVLRYLLAAGLPLAAGAAVTARPLTHALYGQSFDAAVTPMRFLAAIIPLVAVQAVLWRVLSVRSQQGIVFRVQLASVGFRIAAAVPLIAIAGATGAAVSVLVAFLFHTALLSLFVRREGISLDVARVSWLFAAASAIMAAVAWMLLRHIGLWPTIPAAAAVYLILITPSLALGAAVRAVPARIDSFRRRSAPNGG
jgi:O-antigen/teichoic acid export membrane protein